MPLWDDRFEQILRASLPGLGALEPGVPLRDAGLDSMKIVTILAELEDTYGGMLPDGDVTFAAFATPATLWELVDRELVTDPGGR
jgi:diaminopimelate decarboxylase